MAMQRYVWPLEDLSDAIVRSRMPFLGIVTRERNKVTIKDTFSAFLVSDVKAIFKRLPWLGECKGNELGITIVFNELYPARRLVQLIERKFEDRH